MFEIPMEMSQAAGPVPRMGLVTPNNHLPIKHPAVAHIAPSAARGCSVISYRRRWARCVAIAWFAASAIVFTSVFPASVRAQALDCPKIGAKLPALGSDDAQIKRMTTDNEVDLSNELGSLIRQVKAEYPKLTKDEVANGLLAAYCPIVTRMPEISAAAKWRLIRQFDQALYREQTANAMPKGAKIIAKVPLPPTVYRKLSARASVTKQPAARLMASILTRAVQ